MLSYGSIDPQGAENAMGLSKFFITSLAAVISVLSHPAEAAVISCRAGNVTVTSPDVESAALACSAVQAAVTQFAACRMPALNKPLRIVILDDLDGAFYGLYYIGKDMINVLTPAAMQASEMTENAFAGVEITEYFKSTITHELSHAATEGIPCPFASCISTSEYISYAMQVMSLDPEALAVFQETSRIDRPIATEEFSPVILFMAPSLFAQKVWAHFQQNNAGCDFIGQLVRGETTLDLAPF